MVQELPGTEWASEAVVFWDVTGQGYLLIARERMVDDTLVDHSTLESPVFRWRRRSGMFEPAGGIGTVGAKGAAFFHSPSTNEDYLALAFHYRRTAINPSRLNLQLSSPVLPWRPGQCSGV